MKVLKPMLVTVSLVTGLSLVLAGCSNSSSDKSYYKQQRSYQQAKKHGNTYKLAFFENKASDDTDTTYYALGYYDDGNLVQKQLNSDSNAFNEIIEPNCKVPYVQISKSGHYWIHRPPYNTYNQPAVKGTVTSKD